MVRKLLDWFGLGCKTKLLLLLAFFIGNGHATFLPKGGLASTKSYHFQHIFLPISV
jgi:hypothetical protein